MASAEPRPSDELHTDHVVHLTPEQRDRARRAAVASSIGNALEWFDIIVYAFMAVPIAKAFFPSESDGIAGLLITFATFAVSYLIRPLGALVIGHYGDRHGRKAALTFTIFAMMLGTLMMLAAPAYAQIGAWGGVWLLAARLVQGFSAGGEFGSSTAFLTENAADAKAYYASFQVATQGASMFLAAAWGYGLNTWLTADQLTSWGWRLPYAFGLLIGPVGLYIRMKMDETPEFATAEVVASPVGETFRNHLGRVLTAAACVGMATMSVYLITYLPTFAIKSLKLPGYSGYVGAMVAGLVTLFGTPAIGRLADRKGPVTVMGVAAVVGLVVAYPAFAILKANPNLGVLTAVMVLVGALMAMYFGPLPALLSSIFPTEIRTTGMSLAYNIGVSLMGGFAPMILTWLVDTTKEFTSPSYYYMACTLVSAVGLFFARRVYRQR